MKQPKQWAFDVYNKAGEKVAFLSVHKGTGRWMYGITDDAEPTGESEYAWDATVNYLNNLGHVCAEQQMVVTAKSLRAYRKATKVAPPDEAQEAAP